MISRYLSELLFVAEKQIPHILQDTTAFLNIIKSKNKVDENTLLVTLDVTSLYTNIPQEEGANWVTEFYSETLSQWSNYSPGLLPVKPETVKEMILFVLKNSTFEFDNEFYVQNYGTTMGSSFSVRFANIYMHQFLKNFFQKHPSLKPEYVARLIDDIFFTWDKNKTELDTLINELNSCHQTIKFEPTISETEVHFLDTTVCIDKGDYSLHTKLYRKPTYRVQYLHFGSNHPKHVKKAIPYSQAIRYRRVIDNDDILRNELDTLKQYFKLRNYPAEIVNSEIDKVHSVDRSKTLMYKTAAEKKENFNKFTKGGAFLPLITTFDPRVAKELKTNLAQKWIMLLDQNEKLKAVFKNSTPQIVFKRGTTIEQNLIRAKFRSNNSVNRPVNQAEMPPATLAEDTNYTHKCNTRHCLCCDSIECTYIFKSSTTKEEFEINEAMNCNTDNVIYLITCTKCKKQYIGQTQRRLKDRLNAHRSNVNKKVSTSVGIHFNYLGHSFLNLRITPIEKVDNINLRLEREKFWIKKLKTKYPDGLNNYPIEYSQTGPDTPGDNMSNTPSTTPCRPIPE
jgi:hypothetical protein